jgi:hypothetical protein
MRASPKIGVFGILRIEQRLARKLEIHCRSTGHGREVGGGGADGFELLANRHFGGRGDAIKEKDAIEVIDFMLKGTGQQAIGLDHHLSAIELREATADAGRAVDGCADAANAQAAFRFHGTRTIELELGIDDHHGHVLLHVDILAIDREIADAAGIVRDIDDGHAQGDSDLRCGKAYAVSVIHGFQHVFGESDNFIGDFSDIRAFFTEDWVTDLDNFKEHKVGYGKKIRVEGWKLWRGWGEL